MKKFTLILAIVAFSAMLSAQNYVSTEPQNKNAILEEFTGVSCPNCPAGHQVAAAILAANPGRAFCIAYHPANSSYTSPHPGDPDFRRDYPNAFYSTPYCGSSRFMPSAFINRRIWGNGERIQSRTEWTQYCDDIMAEPSPANIGLYTSYDFMSQILYIMVEVYYTENMTDDNHIYVLLAENDLVSQQSGATGSYTHKHTFREAYVAQWGDLITAPTTQGSLVTMEYQWDATGSGYIMGNCEVMAFIENQTTEEIITGVGVHVGEATYIEPTAGFSVDDNTVGVGNQAVFSDESTGAPTAWEWTFEGGDPASSNLQNPPPVTYEEPGQYSVSLTVTNPAGTSNSTISNYMDIGYAPEVEFIASQTLLVAGGSTDFTDNSTYGPTTWYWEFPGGTPINSTEQHPTNITYDTPGDYDVVLAVTNEYGNSAMTKFNYIHVGEVGIQEQLMNKQLVAYPNPCDDILFIKLEEGLKVKEANIRNSSGQIIMTLSIENSPLQSVDVNKLPAGLYYLEVSTTEEILIEKIIVK